MNDDEVLRLLAEQTKAAIAGAVARVPVPTQLPGTVLSYDPVGKVATVNVDGTDSDNDAVEAENLTGWPLSPDDRVMVTFQPPHGAFVSSRFGDTAGTVWIRCDDGLAVDSTSQGAGGAMSPLPLGGLVLDAVTGDTAGSMEGNIDAFIFDGLVAQPVAPFGPAAQITLSGGITLAPSAVETITVTIQDAAGATVTSGADSAVSVTFSQISGTGSVGGLGTVVASGGVAALAITGFQSGPVNLRASATLSAGARTSAVLGITVTGGAGFGAATQIALSGGPNLAPGQSETLTATIQDAAGLTVTSGADSAVSVNFTQPSGTGSVSVPGTATAVNGVARLSVTAFGAGSVNVTAQAVLNGVSRTSPALAITVTSPTTSHTAGIPTNGCLWGAYVGASPGQTGTPNQLFAAWEQTCHRGKPAGVRRLYVSPDQGFDPNARRPEMLNDAAQVPPRCSVLSLRVPRGVSWSTLAANGNLLATAAATLGNYSHDIVVCVDHECDLPQNNHSVTGWKNALTTQAERFAYRSLVTNFFGWVRALAPKVTCMVNFGGYPFYDGRLSAANILEFLPTDTTLYDMISFDPYNNSYNGPGGYQDQVAALCDKWINLTDGVGPDSVKCPLGIAETGVNIASGIRAQWASDLRAYIKNHSNIKFAMWFNTNTNASNVHGDQAHDWFLDDDVEFLSITNPGPTQIINYQPATAVPAAQRILTQALAFADDIYFNPDMTGGAGMAGTLIAGTSMPGIGEDIGSVLAAQGVATSGFHTLLAPAIPGVYSVWASATFDPNGTGHRFIDIEQTDSAGNEIIRINGDLIPAVGDGTFTICSVGPVPLRFNQGDGINIRARQHSGGNLQIVCSHASMTWIGQ